MISKNKKHVFFEQTLRYQMKKIHKIIKNKIIYKCHVHSRGIKLVLSKMFICLTMSKNNLIRDIKINIRVLAC